MSAPELRCRGSSRGKERATKRRITGVSLVELMVGVAIGLVLITFIIRGFAASTGVSAVNSTVSEYQTNGRHAIETLTREVRHAALSPLLWDATQIEASAAAASRNFGCGAGLITQVRQGLTASDDSNPYAANCLAPGNDRSYARGDVLTLRRLGLAPVTSFRSNAPYVRTSYGAGRVFLGGETPAALPAPSFDHEAVSDVYFVNEFTYSADESPRVPALYRLTLSSGADPVLVPELVASNVEHMQLQFGVADASGNVRYLDPSGVSDWGQVLTARIWLLLRASAAENGLVASSHSLGNVTYSPTDSYRRVVLSSTIQVRNR